MSEGLPLNWQYTSLNMIADWGSGGTPKATEPKFYNGDIPWLIIADLNNSVVTKSAKKITQLGFDNSSTKWVEIGSVMIAMYGSIGKLGIAGIRCTTNQAIAFTSKIWGRIPNKYLFYYLKYNEPELLNVGQGGAQKNISQAILKQYPFPLPPLNEQKRIVAKLDAIMPRIDAVKTRLDTVPTIIKRFRQSVLTAAVTGRLTEKWRKDLQNEEDWIETSLESLIEYVTSGSRGWAKYYSEEGAIFVRAQNIKTDELILKDVAFVHLPTKTEGTRTRIKKNDILITITGANVTKTALVGYEIDEAYVNQHVALVRPKNKDFSVFLYLWLISPIAGRLQLEDAAYGAGKPGLNLRNIKDVQVNLPPLEEQKEIVRQVDKLFAMADKVEAQYKNAKEHVDKLSQSVLAKAFRGELVPQDPQDEPAEILLERIMEEKAKMEAELKAKKKTKKIRSKTKK